MATNEIVKTDTAVTAATVLDSKNEKRINSLTKFGQRWRNILRNNDSRIIHAEVVVQQKKGEDYEASHNPIEKNDLFEWIGWLLATSRILAIVKNIQNKAIFHEETSNL